jgi:hypothetical protein
MIIQQFAKKFIEAYLNTKANDEAKRIKDDGWCLWFKLLSKLLYNHALCIGVTYAYEERFGFIKQI